jgi:hypothetical protein
VGEVLVRRLTVEERERCRAWLEAQARARFERDQRRLGNASGIRRPRVAKRQRSRRSDARLAAGEIAEAWTLYEAGSSLRDLAGELWQLHGFASVGACEEALRKAFHREGWPIRTRTKAGKLERRRRRGEGRSLNSA